MTWDPREGPGGGPACIESLGLAGPEEAASLHAALSVREHDYYAFIMERGDGWEVRLIVAVGFDCLEAVAVEVRGCGGARERVYGITDWPEISRVEVEGDCAYALAPAEPPYRVAATLHKLGLASRAPRGLEPLDAGEVEDRLGGEVPGTRVA